MNSFTEKNKFLSIQNDLTTNLDYTNREDRRIITSSSKFIKIYTDKYMLIIRVIIFLNK